MTARQLKRSDLSWVMSHEDMVQLRTLMTDMDQCVMYQPRAQMILHKMKALVSAPAPEPTPLNVPEMPQWTKDEMDEVIAVRDMNPEQYRKWRGRLSERHPAEQRMPQDRLHLDPDGVLRGGPSMSSFDLKEIKAEVTGSLTEEGAVYFGVGDPRAIEETGLSQAKADRLRTVEDAIAALDKDVEALKRHQHGYPEVKAP